MEFERVVSSVTFKVSDVPVIEMAPWGTCEYESEGARPADTPYGFRPDQVHVYTEPARGITNVTISGPAVTGGVRQWYPGRLKVRREAFHTLPEWVKGLPGYPWTE